MTRSEHSEQKLLCGWLRARCVPHFSVPNGAMLGGRSKFALLNKLKAEGMMPGMPDLVLIKRHESGAPVAIEMKRRKGGKLSDRQAGAIDLLESFGWIVIQAKGYDEAVTQLEKLGF